MQRFRKIQNQVLEIIEENIELKQKIEFIENGTTAEKAVSQEYNAILYFAKLKVKEIFEKLVRHTWRVPELTYSEVGASIELEQWVRDMFVKGDDKELTSLSFNLSIKEAVSLLIKLGAKEVYDEEVEKAKMEYVRSHKGGGE